MHLVREKIMTESQVLIAEIPELLRAAHEIAKRRGRKTNWAAFEFSLQKTLLALARLNPSFNNKETIAKLTWTVRTYRIK